MSEIRPPFYDLLPAYLRNRDWYEGEPLRALLAVLERQHRRLEDDVEGLYEDWFIETCRERIVPLLGDLLGVRGLADPDSWVPGQRTRVANSLAYRQAKGTPATLARVARDVTGWPASARSGFRSVLFAQSLDAPRLRRGRTVDLRREEDLAALDGAFDRHGRVVRVSGPAEPGATTACGAGLGPGDLAFHFWRLRSYPVRGWTPRALGADRYTFHPLGFDVPLFEPPRSPRDLDRPIGPENVPRPLGRRALAAILDAPRRRRGEAAGPSPPLEIVDPLTGAPVPSEAIAVADLSTWERPAATGASRERPIRVTVDPELGRFVFSPGRGADSPARVSCSYGFSADLGGGAYERPPVVDGLPEVHAAAIGDAPSPSGGGRFRGVLEAVDARPLDADVQVLRIGDSASYGEVAGLPLVIGVPKGAWLVIEAAPGHFPCYVGNLVFVAGGDSPATRVTLAGLLVGGTVELRGAARLEIRHCTVMTPPELGRVGPGVAIAGRPRPTAAVRIESSIVGPLRLPPGIAGLEIADTVVDGLGGYALAADDEGGAGPLTGCVRSTLFGPVSVSEMRTATDTLFTDPLRVRKRSSGLLRHSYCPPGDGGPPRERCVPDDALAAARGSGRRAELLARLRPVFASRSFLRPDYAQLSPRTAPEIRTGASGGSEIGVFAGLRNARRERNLHAILREYLPWGLEARTFYES